MLGLVVTGLIICLSMIFFLLKSSSQNKTNKEKIQKEPDIKDKKEEKVKKQLKGMKMRKKKNKIFLKKTFPNIY